MDGCRRAGGGAVWAVTWGAGAAGTRQRVALSLAALALSPKPRPKTAPTLEPASRKQPAARGRTSKGSERRGTRGRYVTPLLAASDAAMATRADRETGKRPATDLAASWMCESITRPLRLRLQ